MGGKRRAQPLRDAQANQPAGRTRVGLSEDTLQRMLPLLVDSVLPHLGPEAVFLCVKASKAWRRELEARGFCRRTFALCLALAQVMALHIRHTLALPPSSVSLASSVNA